MAETLKTSNLIKEYNDFKALNNVSITVESGDIYGLIGKNGAGKTTLFKVVMGLTEKTSGEIIIDGSKDLNKARSNIGFMIGPSFFSYLNAHKNIEYSHPESNKDHCRPPVAYIHIQPA